MQVNVENVRKFYGQLSQKMDELQQAAGRPLTLTEKILYAHVASGPYKPDLATPLKSFLCKVDHLAIDDAAAQIACLQFPWCGEKNVAVSTSIHCDHMVIAESGAESDLMRGHEEHGEIINFLQSFSAKYGIGFWKPGCGIIHHHLLEHYAFPGALMIVSDAYAPYAGGLGAFAFQGNSADVLDLMTGLPYELSFTKKIAVRLSGQLAGWASAKDVGLKLVQILAAIDVKGAVIEYFGEGGETISCSGKGVLCSMGAEAGALTSLFPYDSSMHEFLMSTGREEVALLARHLQRHLQADLLVLANPEIYYDQVVEIDLSAIEPQVGGPFSSDRCCSLTEFSTLAFNHGYPEKISAALIGSINSSYEDLEKAALVARQGLKHGLKTKIPLLISPGSDQIKSKLIEAGLWKVLKDVGAIQLAGARGPSEGQWKRVDTPFGEKNSILTSYNRASLGLYDGNPGTHTFIASAEVVMALALAGSLNFNPVEDALLSPQGLPVRLSAPVSSKFLPSNKKLLPEGFVPCVEDGSILQIAIDPLSERLQVIEPFKPHLDKSFSDLRLLIKASGKCSSNQISPGGKWLKYRGHIATISNNLFSLAPNEFRDEIGRGKNLLSGAIEPFAKIARDYKKEEIGWIVIAHENYGEGLYNEHAALALRFLGGKAVIAQSIDSAHEMILKKQGILALTFAGPDNGDRIREDDLIDLLGINELAVGRPLELLLKHADGSTERLKLQHSYSEAQLGWFKAGNFLSYIANK